MDKEIIYFSVFFIFLFILTIGFVFINYFKKNKTSNLSLNNTNMENINYKNAYFAGGCFWCMEGIFEAQDGVKEAVSGYIGGDKESAKYDIVSTGTTSHREAIKVVYNPEKISFDDLVEIYWRQIDPTDEGGQFADRGYQYTTAIYYSNEREKEIATKSKEKLGNSGKFDKPIATQIVEFSEFFEAEDYHQDYYKKSPFRYGLYKKGSGREGYIKETWGQEDKKTDLKARLTPLQYKVTQEDGTEKPFNNEYWDNHEDGIYVDIVDGTPLFSSLDKYESGTGWPSFTKPISMDNLVENEDNTLFMKRTEVRSKYADSHLGHVFSDGPVDKGGQRYCMNSASFEFVPVDEMEERGYGDLLKIFDK